MSLGWRETFGGQSVGRWFHKQLFDVSNSRPTGAKATRQRNQCLSTGVLGCLALEGQFPSPAKPGVPMPSL